jgi:hypothetical protein
VRTAADSDEQKKGRRGQDKIKTEVRVDEPDDWRIRRENGERARMETETKNDESI